MKEQLWNERADYLTQAAPLVVQKVAENERRAVEDQLVQLSERCELAADDPIVMLFLACLYGSDAARKVIKPARPNAYNVLCDLHVIPRVGMVKAVAATLPHRVKVRFWTLDEGLDAVLSRVDIVLSHFTVDGELQMQLRYNPELFPELINDEGDPAAAIAMLHRVAAAAAGRSKVSAEATGAAG